MEVVQVVKVVKKPHKVVVKQQNTLGERSQLYPLYMLSL